MNFFNNLSENTDKVGSGKTKEVNSDKVGGDFHRLPASNETLVLFNKLLRCLYQACDH